jgi:hypothetical protein
VFSGLCNAIAGGTVDVVVLLELLLEDEELELLEEEVEEDEEDELEELELLVKRTSKYVVVVFVTRAAESLAKTTV